MGTSKSEVGQKVTDGSISFLFSLELVLFWEFFDRTTRWRTLNHEGGPGKKEGDRGESNQGGEWTGPDTWTVQRDPDRNTGTVPRTETEGIRTRCSGVSDKGRGTPLETVDRPEG